MKKSMRILCIIFAIICFAYYIRCAAYAGVKSSFIWIWLVGTAAFCILYILGLLEDRHIYTLPRMVKYISLVIICFGTALFITLEMCITFCMKKKPEDNCDYIIVLGCQIRGDRITKSLKTDSMQHMIMHATTRIQELSYLADREKVRIKQKPLPCMNICAAGEYHQNA